MSNNVPKKSGKVNASVTENSEENIHNTDTSSGTHTPRVLIFTKDKSIAEEGSASFRRISGLKDVFQEVHIVILDLKTDSEDFEVIRLFKNIWLYKTESTSWWKLSRDAYRLAEKQMIFNGVFRADVIIAEDPFESGLAGWFLSKKYESPMQLHIYEDFYDEVFLETTNHPTLYEWSVNYLLKKVKSVRTKTEFQRQAVIEENKKLKDNVETLPSYYNLEAWRDAKPAFDLKKKYSQFKFIMLHISLMRNSSHSSEVLAGAATILKKYQTICLVVVGSGPLRSHLEKQAIELGVEKQIKFEPMPSEILSHLKTAHVLLHLSENSEEDETLLAAASVKLPMIALSTGLAGKLFVDDESAQLCDVADVTCVSSAINRYLNENRDRSSFALRAHEIVFDKIVQDYDAYIEAYKNSVERCLK